MTSTDHVHVLSPAAPPARRRTTVTRARVLLTLSGFVSVVSGLVEFGPDARPALRPVGATLVVIGLLTWALVARLRRPYPAAVRATATVAMALAAVRLAQSGLVHSTLPLVALLLPALALRQVARSRGTTPPVPGRVVPVTVAVLAVLTGATLAYALLPADLPVTANAAGLRDDQSPTTPPEPDPTGYVRATDGTRLAYFADVPADPIATLVFYHGSGANAGAGYLNFGREVAQRYHVATYLFDMRGHGRSDGPKGDAPSQAQMFADTRSAVDFVKHTHPRLPEYVGGHSAGAGLVLNSEDRIDHEVAGYVYLAPDFGLHSDTQRQSEGSNFATISHRVLIADVLTNGLLNAHAPAVSFAYTQEEVARAGLVTRYTPTMAIAQDAGDSAAVLAGTRAPVGVWIGADDEVLDPAKVLAWARNAPHVTTTELPGVDHLGVVDRSVTDVGTWIDRHAAG